MDLLWPGFLILLITIPVFIVAYLWILRRRRRYAVRYSSLSLVREAAQGSNRLKRHLPFVLFLLAVAFMIAALSRPVAVVTVPTDQTTIILTLDVSGSMRSTDIYPSRLGAAEAAALTFIQRQKSTTQIGLVAFSGFAETIMPPTTNQEALQAAVESLTTGRRTAIGSGILESINTISQIDINVAPAVTDSSSGNQPTPVPAGMYAPDIIVLLTDGVSNAGPSPLDAAQQAADRGVRIYTIGYGTANGSVPFDQNFYGGPGGGQGGGGGGGGGGGYGGGGYGGGGPRGRFRAGIDEETLKQIASMTGGQYFSATSADELQAVFRSLPTYLISKHAAIEISVFFTAAGAILLLLAIGLALRWQPVV